MSVTAIPTIFVEFNGEFTSFDEAMKTPMVKENEPFEVTESEGLRLIETGVFRAHTKKITQSMLPSEFPAREILEKNKIYTFEQVSVMTVEQLKEIKNIGDGLAEQIKSAVHKYAEENEIKLSVEVQN